MNVSYATLVAATIVFIATPARAGDVHWNKDCDNDTPMVEINACAGQKFKQADDEMNRLYNEKIATMRTEKNKNRLRDAQRAWVSFRDKVCLYEARPAAESGSIWPFQHFGCMEFYTNRRIEDLQFYLECTTDDCPN